MLKASAVNVVDMMLRPAMPGTMMLSAFWSLDARPPISASRISGSRKLKKAAEGLRQNIRRSSRYCRQVRAGALSIVGQLEVDVLQRGARHGQVAQPFSARKCRLGQLVQQRRGIVGLALLDQAAAVAPGHAVAAGVARARLARCALGGAPPVLEDRDPAGRRRGLLRVVGGQQDGLAQPLERARGVPRRPPTPGFDPAARRAAWDTVRSLQG